MTTLDCILLKDGSLILAVGLGPEISFQAFLWVLIRPHHIVICWLSIQHIIFLLIFYLKTPKVSSGPTNFSTAPSLCELVSNLIFSYPRIFRDPKQLHSMLGGNVIWCLLALLYQREGYFSRLKGFQSRLTVRANTIVLA